MERHLSIDSERHLSIDSEAGGERYPARRPLDVRELLAVFAGGVIGALARASLERSVPVHGAHWPWATLSVNLIGAAVLGYAVALLQRSPPTSPYPRAFVAAGICGTLTTFSAMVLELQRMLAAGRPGIAFAYAAASIAGGLAAVTLGGRVGARRALAAGAAPP